MKQDLLVKQYSFQVFRGVIDNELLLLVVSRYRSKFDRLLTNRTIINASKHHKLFNYWHLPNLCKVIDIFLNYCLVRPRNIPHERALRVILANARSDHHFKIQIGYFGYCRIPLNTEKITI